MGNAVVTGASSAIGKAIALGLGGQGPILGLVGRRLEAPQVVAESARAVTQRIHCYQAA